MDSLAASRHSTVEHAVAPVIVGLDEKTEVDDGLTAIATPQPSGWPELKSLISSSAVGVVAFSKPIVGVPVQALRLGQQLVAHVLWI
jgi:hypothetical protein